MDVDGALALVGTPGRFAWIVLFLVYICSLLVCWNDIFPGVYSATPAHHCRLPDGLTLNDSVPVDERGEFSRCEVYVNYSSESGETTLCPDGWHYTVEEGETTVPTEVHLRPKTPYVYKCSGCGLLQEAEHITADLREWDLVCDKKYLNNLSTSLYYVGIVVGSLIFGTLSDRVGRKPVLIFCLFTPLFAGILVYFAESLVVFVALRFIIGILKQGVQINTFVLAMELFTSSKHLGVVAAVLETTWSVGGSVLSLLSWVLQDWRRIQLVIMSPCLLALPYIWYMPESLRWQISTERYSEAEKNLRFAARINGVDLTEKLKSAELKSLLSDSARKEAEQEVKYQLLDLFRFPKMRLWTALLCFIWFANSCTGYLILLSIPTLPGNRFLGLGIAAAVDLPVVILVAVFSHRIKRRLCLVSSCALTGIFGLATSFTLRATDSGAGMEWVILGLVYLAKFCTAITWTVVSLITCEIYPTVIRSIGCGLCMVAAKFGSIFAPQIIYLGEQVAGWLPLLILGVAILLAALFCLLLPETLGTAMPNTIEEAEKRTCLIGRKGKMESGPFLQTKETEI